MKIAKILSTAVLSLLLLSACGKGGENIITVNGEPITRAEYDAEYKKVLQTPHILVLEPKAKDQDSFFGLMTRDRIVNELIVKKILEQEMEKRGITVTDEDIKQAKEDIIQKVGGEEKFKELTKQSHVSDKQLREDIINEVKVNKLVEATADVKVSDNEVREFYNKNQKNFDFPERVRAYHILIDANPEAIRQEVVNEDKKGLLNAEQIEEKMNAAVDKKFTEANDLREKLVKNPEDFEKLAKEYSDDITTAQKGGDLGYFPKDAMVKPFADVAFSIKPGSISEVVKTPFGYHIIKVTDRAQAGLAPYEQVAPEIKAYLEQTKKIEALQKLFDGLKSSAKIEYNDPAFDPKNIQVKIREKAAQEQQELKQKEDAEGEDAAQPFSPAR